MNFWMDKGISGWRLDVIDELATEIYTLFLSKIEEINTDAVIIGEVWEDASNKIAYNVHREYFCGYEMDSAMNYPLRRIILDFILKNKSAQETEVSILNQHENYPEENLYAMMNLLGSHDVERILTLLGEAPSVENVPASVTAKYEIR